MFQITLGRATKDKQIDVDLSLEGPAWKISRKQGQMGTALFMMRTALCEKPCSLMLSLALHH